MTKEVKILIKKMRCCSCVIVLLLVAAAFLPSCSNGQGTDGNNLSRFESLKRNAIDAYVRDSLAKSDSLGRLLYKEAVAEQNEMYEAYGLLIQGLYPKTSQNAGQRLELVKEAEKKALAINNDTLLSWVYNVLGIYSIVYTFNFSEARQYYTEAIRYAERGKENHFRISAECNISELYSLFGDTLGIKYDLDIYDYSVKAHNTPLLIASAKRIAEYYIGMKGNESKALSYIEDIRNNGNTYLSELVKGKYYYALDSLGKAKEMFEKALRRDTITPNIYLSYARLLNSLGDYRKSNVYLDTAYQSFKEIEDQGFDYIETMRIYSDNMRRLGNDREALKYLDRYLVARDSVNGLRNREEINSYKVKFDVEKKELELAASRETMKHQRMMIWAVCVIAVLTIGFYLIYDYRKKRMYRLIVRQHRDFLMQNRANSPQVKNDGVATDTDDNKDLSDNENKESSDDKETLPCESDNAKGGLSKEKADAIWNAILNEMDNNKIYADPELSRDIFSERIGCNHTWFSQVIKEKTGKTYLQFINGRRVTEAVKVLSDPTSDVPIKSLAYSIGFTSLSTFYTAFKQQIGMSPAEFRKLSLQDTNKDN